MLALGVGVAVAALAVAGAAGPAVPPGEELIVFASDRDDYDLYAVSIGGGVPVLVLPSPAQERDPSLSPDGTRIAFVRDDGGHGDLYVLDRTSGAERQLTSGAAHDEAPSWSPDGERLVFVRNGALHVLGLGSGVRRLTSGRELEWQPAWGPGDLIAFNRAGRLWTIRSDGSGVRRLVQGDPPLDVYGSHPSWSPDGARLAFTFSSATGPFIAVIDIDGGDLRELGRGYAPSWSPAGDEIVFASYGLMVMRPDGSRRRALIPPIPFRYSLHLRGDFDPAAGPAGLVVFSRNEAGLPLTYVVRPDGTALRRLSPRIVEEYTPAVSPDGRFVAFRRRFARGIYHVFVRRIDGTGERRLTYRYGSGTDHLAWSPDGRRIVFSALDRFGGGLWTVAARGGEPRRIPNSRGAGSPSWSPDGKRLAVLIGDRLGVLAVDGSTRRVIGRRRCEEGSPAWSPDGRWIAFTRLGGIHLIRPDGTGHRLLLPVRGHTFDGFDCGRVRAGSRKGVPNVYSEAVWSPDGRRLAVVAAAEFDDNESEIWMVERDGDLVGRIVADGRGASVHLSWSRGEVRSRG